MAGIFRRKTPAARPAADLNRGLTMDITGPQAPLAVTIMADAIDFVTFRSLDGFMAFIDQQYPEGFTCPCGCGTSEPALGDKNEVRKILLAVAAAVTSMRKETF